ncbi:MAG: LPS export ABC transporter periplasmic protein LptC [Acidocella sp.]|nr:LPS export ABC transporter periplasmic protein LptC [Acidocella sp.]
MSPAHRERILDGLRRRNPEIVSAIARRSAAVTLGKRLLPVAAAGLIAALAIAPSLHSGPEANRVTYHVRSTSAGASGSTMQSASYHGLDQHGQPFTLTATSADERNSDNIALTQPEGDITLTSGAWLMLKSDTGMYHQKTQRLGLTGNVTLYRNDGTTLNVARADIDMKGGNAQSNAPVQAQGPFGTLNAANGFVLADRGQTVTFNGPATLILTQAQ